MRTEVNYTRLFVASLLALVLAGAGCGSDARGTVVPGPPPSGFGGDVRWSTETADTAVRSPRRRIPHPTASSPRRVRVGSSLAMHALLHRAAGRGYMAAGLSGNRRRL